MKVGDLIKCTDTGEVAVVVDSYWAGYCFWILAFWQDGSVSATISDNLEVVNESR